jgi:predicted amidohydrolase
MSTEAETAAGRPNLVENGRFSQVGAEGLPHGWEIVRPAGLPPVVQVAVDREVTRGGGATVRFHGTAGDTGVAGLRQALPAARAGTTYRLSAWVKRQEVAEPRRSIGLRLRWRGRVEEYAMPVAREGEWERWERVIRVADGAEGIEVELMLQWTGGTAWFGDVRVEETAPARRRLRVATVYWRPQKRTAVDANLSQFCRLVDRAADAGAEMVCLPETLLGIGTGGPGPGDAMPIPGPATEAFGERARLRHLWVCAGLSERDGDRIYNSAVLLDRHGRLVGKYRKTHLPIQEVEAGFTPGRELPVFDTEFGRVGMLICHDTAFPEPARVLAMKGAELVLLPIWGGSDLYVRSRAADNGFFIVSSSYDFPCGVISPTGEWLCQSAREPDGSLVTCEIDLEDSQRTVAYEGRFHGNHRRERNPAAYGELLRD